MTAWRKPVLTGISKPAKFVQLAKRFGSSPKACPSRRRDAQSAGGGGNHPTKHQKLGRRHGQQRCLGCCGVVHALAVSVLVPTLAREISQRRLWYLMIRLSSQHFFGDGLFFGGQMADGQSHARPCAVRQKHQPDARSSAFQLPGTQLQVAPVLETTA